MSKLKSIDIKGKPYIEVNERLKEFRINERYKDYSLETELISLQNGFCTMKAVIKNPEGRIIATGFAQEKENSSFINKTSYIENCETSAWGRALGNLGIGIDTSIASADEVLNAIANQNKPQAKNILAKNEAANENKEPDNDLDFDVIVGLQSINDLENLNIYYKSNVKAVKDKEAFIEACKRRKQAIGTKEAAELY